MSKSKVIVVPCFEYDEEKVYLSVKRGIDALGGIEQFVNINDKILVKPNFLSPGDNSRAVTTNPTVTKAVLRILNEAGCRNVKYGDSPGHGSCKDVAATAGPLESEAYGATLADMSSEVLFPYEDGITCKEFYFTKEVVESDVIINVCKMKTHALERITGAVKNLYGLICGFRKGAGHVKYPNDTIFARMLCDIHRCVNCKLHIMDGIVAMEGNGPGSGTPINMNVLLFSNDPVAMDTVFCYLIDLNPQLVPTNSQGAATGIGNIEEDEIEIVIAEDTGCVTVSKDELFEKFGNAKYDVARQKPKKSFLQCFSIVMTKFSKRPYIKKADCVKCGVCVKHCPVPGKAISFANGKDNAPVYDYSKCIRCYCCQEMCPKHAISVRGK